LLVDPWAKFINIGTDTVSPQVTYFKRESVDLAKMILDGAEIKPGYPVQVSEVRGRCNKPADGQTVTDMFSSTRQAKFEHKEGNTQQPPAKKRKTKKKKPRINQEDELRWEDWETRQHVILFNLFDPKEAVVRTRSQHNIPLTHLLLARETRSFILSCSEIYAKR
jgi:ribosomal protein S10